MGRCLLLISLYGEILFSEVSEIHTYTYCSCAFCRDHHLNALGYIHMWLHQPPRDLHLTTQLNFIQIKLSWIFAFYDVAFNWQCSQWHLQKVSREWEKAVSYIGTKFRLRLSSVIWTITMETSVSQWESEYNPKSTIAGDTASKQHTGHENAFNCVGVINSSKLINYMVRDSTSILFYLVPAVYLVK